MKIKGNTVFGYFWGYNTEKRAQKGKNKHQNEKKTEKNLFVLEKKHIFAA